MPERETRGESASPAFLKGTRGSEEAFLNCFYSIFATVFQPENTTEVYVYFMFKIDRNSPKRFIPLSIQS